MTDVHWLVEDGPFEEDIIPILEEIEAQGHLLTLEKYIPFGGGNYNHLFRENECVVFYGSINFAQRIQRTCPWVPGPIATFPNYDMLHFYANYHMDALNEHPKFFPWGYARQRLRSRLNKNLNTFIRPNVGTKLFAGQVIRRYTDIDYLDTRCQPHDLVLMDEYKPIQEEYRLVIADRKVIAGSLYKKNNSLEPVISADVPQRLILGVNDLLEDRQQYEEYGDWQPDPVYVMDVSYDPDISLFSIIELNSVSCSGWYACDPKPIVEAMSLEAQREWKSIYEWNI